MLVVEQAYRGLGVGKISSVVVTHNWVLGLRLRYHPISVVPWLQNCLLGIETIPQMLMLMIAQ